MSFISSCLLRRPGNHTILGIPVSMELRRGCSAPQQTVHYRHIPRIFLNNVLHNPLHTLIHEMGHALTNKWFGNTGVRVNIVLPGNDLTSRGETHVDAYGSVRGWRDSITLAAGPIASSSFSTIQLLAQYALKNVLPMPIQGVLGISAAFNLIDQAQYVIKTALNIQYGDFVEIRKNSLAHLLVASTVFSAVTGIGVAVLAKGVNHITNSLCSLSLLHC